MNRAEPVKPYCGAQAQRQVSAAVYVVHKMQWEEKAADVGDSLPLLLPHSLEHKPLFYAMHFDFNIKSAAIQLNLVRGNVKMLSHGRNRRRAETSRGSFRSIH